ncbi:hypothetical protein KRR39_02160 [Nocardioides panacis]|uniref:Uncharacterized protein n=1 Tax=Nocardioides panacis TaxID=2849501 RepID=A0A975T0A5_9ACTN|nr:hypothetical protein [Nocardioides panacis]QWZ08685.1 hypothetical protein KRR39_02160 [Nocardioides panacis]
MRPPTPPDALILTDLLSRDLRRGCQVPVDLRGLTYDRDALPHRPDGTAVSRSHNVRWQHDLGSYLLSGQAIFVLRPRGDGSYGTAVRRLQSLPALEAGTSFALLGNGSASQPEQPDTGDVPADPGPGESSQVAATQSRSRP